MERKCFIPYIGGKFYYTEFINQFLPYSDKYCEPFFGGGSVFWNRKPSHSEIINDKDSRLINLLRVLQDTNLSQELLHKLAFTPFAFQEHKLAKEILSKPCENKVLFAWAYLVAILQSYSSKMLEDEMRWIKKAEHKRIYVFRGHVNKLPFFLDRLLLCCIDCRDALDVIKIHDGTNTVFYLDPPYTFDTRYNQNVLYAYEYTNEQHKALLEQILICKGAVLISGYDNDLYNQRLATWYKKTYVGRISMNHVKDKQGKRHCNKRTEVVWFNERCNELNLQRSLS